MHEHDIDLIMSLVAGELTGDEEAAASAEIAACDRCRADLEAQHVALAALNEAPRAYLSAVESAGLREAVAGSVGLQRADETVRRPARRRFRLGALAGAAAVLIGVMVAAPALNLLGSDSPETLDNVALSPPETQERIATLELDDGAPAPSAAESAEPVQTSGTSEPDTSAGEEFTAALPPTEVEALPRLPADADLGILAEDQAQRRSAAISEEAPLYAYSPPPDSADLADPEVPVEDAQSGFAQSTLKARESLDRCDLGQLDEAAYVEFLGLIDRDGVDRLVVAYGSDGGAVTVAVIDLDSCEILETS